MLIFAGSDSVWRARNRSFVCCTKYNLKLYELNELDVRRRVEYKERMVFRDGGVAIVALLVALVVCEVVVVQSKGE